MASPSAVERLVLVVDPHVPVCSPVPINSILSSLYVDAIICPYFIALIISFYAAMETQLGFCESLISIQFGV